MVVHHRLGGVATVRQLRLRSDLVGIGTSGCLSAGSLAQHGQAPFRRVIDRSVSAVRSSRSPSLGCSRSKGSTRRSPPTSSNELPRRSLRGAAYLRRLVRFRT
jgi:hypothetical protein